MAPSMHSLLLLLQPLAFRDVHLEQEFREYRCSRWTIRLAEKLYVLQVVCSLGLLLKRLATAPDPVDWSLRLQACKLPSACIAPNIIPYLRSFEPKPLRTVLTTHHRYPAGPALALLAKS